MNNTLNKKIKIDENSVKLIVLAVLIFGLMSLLEKKFTSSANINAMAFQIPELGLFSLAMAFVIIAGGIDLSIVSIANLSGIIIALIMQRAADGGASDGKVLMLTIGAFVIAVVLGIILGGINGFLVSYVGIPPILVTLGTSNLYTGIGMIFTKGNPISGFPEKFLLIGGGKVIGIPISLILLIFVSAICMVILNKTQYGRQLKFVGSNAKASMFAGIDNKKVLMQTFIISGIIAAIAGIEIITRTNSAKANYGSSYIVNSVLCVILGGIAAEGGHGNISGVLLALLSLQFLSSGFNMLHITGTAKEMAWGVLLLLITSLDYYSKQKKLKGDNKKLFTKQKLKQSRE